LSPVIFPARSDPAAGTAWAQVTTLASTLASTLVFAVSKAELKRKVSLTNTFRVRSGAKLSQLRHKRGLT